MSATGVRVLIVDDNPLNLELAKEVLEGAGYAVRQAASGAEALAAVRQELPQIILMDIGMPQMDGYAVLKALRGGLATASIPVVAVTSYAMAGDERRAREAGFDGYIPKPIDVRNLPRMVAELLDRSGSAGA
jgi:two-component system cell cycle response regulator DivK